MDKQIIKLSVLIALFLALGFFIAAGQPTQAASCAYSCGSNETQVSQVNCNIACTEGMVCCELQPANTGAGAGANTNPATSTSSGTPATGNGIGLGDLLKNGNAASSGGGWSLGSIAGFGLPGATPSEIIINILVWILGLFGVIGILGFIISGILYLTAAGDEDRMQSAKRAMMYSIIGVVVGLVGFVIIQAVDMALNAISSF